MKYIITAFGLFMVLKTNICFSYEMQLKDSLPTEFEILDTIKFEGFFVGDMKNQTFLKIISIDDISNLCLKFRSYRKYKRYISKIKTELYLDTKTVEQLLLPNERKSIGYYCELIPINPFLNTIELNCGSEKNIWISVSSIQLIKLRVSRTRFEGKIENSKLNEFIGDNEYVEFYTYLYCK